jgi:Ser/Thr protein kinase RdoA (MazF antagonist)
MIYRATYEGGDHAVALKLEEREAAEREALVYQRLLPAIGERAVRCHGTWEARDPRSAWMVTDWIKTSEFSATSPTQLESLSEMLARVHVGAVKRPELEALPRRDGSHWRRLLVDARSVLEGGLHNPALRPADAGSLSTMVAIFDDVLAHWAHVVDVVDVVPSTLVHGDIAPANVRVVEGEHHNTVVLLDWETAGHGNPLADLPYVDLKAYYRVARSAWPSLRPVTLGLLQTLGAVVWVAYVLLGERANFGSDYPHRAARKVPAYLRWIDMGRLRDLTGAGLER